MGDLHIHNLDSYIKKYNCKTFIETGTGIGTGLDYALKHNFKEYYSIEFVKSLYTNLLPKYYDKKNVFILNQDSINGLRFILNRIDSSPCLFWLDAHFPGADFHLNGYEHMADQPDLHMPLINELKLITEARNNQDVIIIDDLQLYEKGNFELYNAEFVGKFGKKINLEEVFKDRPVFFTRDYRHQGFLIVTPNG